MVGLPGGYTLWAGAQHDDDGKRLTAGFQVGSTRLEVSRDHEGRYAVTGTANHGPLSIDHVGSYPAGIRLGSALPE